MNKFNKIASELDLKKKKYVNIGCGPNTLSNFVNIDLENHPGVDLCCDITEGIFLPDESIEGIYTEHCLECITYNECLFVLEECFRVLKKNGVIRIVLPDGGLYLDLYQRAKTESVEFPYIGPEGIADFHNDSRVRFSPMMAVNRIFRGYGHQFAYDYLTMQHMLQYVGFQNVEKKIFRQGRMLELLLDSEFRKPQSFIAEAVKI